VKRSKLGQVAGYHAAPEAHVDVALPDGCTPLGTQRSYVDGAGDTVERHVHEGGDPASRGGFGRRREALPVGMAGFAYVDVGVDEARHEDDAVVQFQHVPGARRVAQRRDRRNPPVPHADRGRDLAAGTDGPRCPDEEVEAVGRAANCPH
jgi:hypothetical protein